MDREPVDIVFVQDRTGSMAWPRYGESKWDVAQAALLMMIAGKESDAGFEKQSDTHVVLFNYDDGPPVVWTDTSLGVPANPNTYDWRSSIRTLFYNVKDVEAAVGCNNSAENFMCTSIGNSMEAAFQQFVSTDRNRAIVLVTDGRDNMSEATSGYMSLEVALQGYFSSDPPPPETSFYAVAVGSDTDDDYLNDLASHGSGFFKSLDFDGLPEIYQAIESDVHGYNTVKSDVNQELAHVFTVAPDDYVLKLTLTANMTDEPLGRRLLAVRPRACTARGSISPGRRMDVFECWCDALCRAWAMIPLPHPLSVDRCYGVLGDGDTLHVLDVTRPSSPEWLGSYEAPGGFSNLKLWRRFVYLDNAAREIVDIRIPEEPAPAGSHDVADWVEGAKQAGDWVFTTDFSFLRAARILIGE
jgi:hypothetical protein